MDSLRFYLNGESTVIHALYELMSSNCTQIWIRDPTPGSKVKPVPLPASALKPVGFGEDEGMLPYPRRSFIGYRLLQEYFTFPEKFFFLDLTELEQVWARGFKDRAEIVFLIGPYDQNQRKQMLELGVTEKTFRLGCAPIVNLFEQTAEPILLDQRKYEYPIVPDVRRPNATEVFSVDEVVSIDPQNRETMMFEPFYSYRHATIRDKKQTFWLAHRRPSGRRNDEGTEMTISLVDLSSRPVLPDTDALTIRTTCTNRDLPARLPFGNEAAISNWRPASAVKRIVALKKPTDTLRPPTGRSVLWRLISHLSLNYLSLVEEGKEALQEILKLYNFTDPRIRRSRSKEFFRFASSEVISRASYRNTGSRSRAGTRVEMELDEEQFVGVGIYLFASIIERFLGLYVSLNSFSQLVASIEAAEGGNPGMAAPSGTPAPAVATAVRYWDVTQLLTRGALDVPVLSGGAPVGAHSAGPLSGWTFRASVEGDRAHQRAHSVTAFPASQIQELRWDAGGAPVLVVNFMGLFGPSGGAAAVLQRDDPGTPACERHHAGRVL